MTRRLFFVALAGQAAPPRKPGCDVTSFVIRPDKSVEVTAPNLHKDQLGNILDVAFIPPAQRGALEKVLAQAPDLTIIFTSKHCAG